MKTRMEPGSETYLRCPGCRGDLTWRRNVLWCEPCGRHFPVRGGIPELLPHDAPELRKRIARLDRELLDHRVFLAMLSVLTMGSVPILRKRFVNRLWIQQGERVLDHCTGPGGNLPHLAEAIGSSGTLAAMDLSRLMLEQASRLARRRQFRVDCHQADAFHLPYADGCFDTVVHTGAINQFGDCRRQAMSEMIRVTKPGGTIAIVDEGVAPTRRRCWWARLLIWKNRLFASRPPLDLLPPEAKPSVEWIVRGIFYQLTFRRPGESVTEPI